MNSTKISISRKTMEQAEVFGRIKNGDISQREAARILNCSERWVRTKLRRYRTNGALGLMHGNSGRPSKRRFSADSENVAIELLKSEWKGFGPTYAAEKLLELKKIVVSEETMRQIMIRHGLWQVNVSRPQHRKRRARRACFGMTIQLDGSPHDWFEGRGPKCTLLVFIDDATSRIVWLEFVTGESVEEVMQATLNYFRKYGMPVEFYVDYGSVFHVNTNNPNHDKLTQFERAMKELGVKVIHARSPQAKGRVERANQTLQDRLVKEMRLAGICSRAEANCFVQEQYIDKHNAKFAVEPANTVNVHRSIEGIELSHSLCTKEQRILQKDFVVVYNKRLFQLLPDQQTIIRPKNEITVNHHLDGSIRLSVRNTTLNFTEISQRPVKVVKEEKPKNIPQQKTPYKPAKNHPWRAQLSKYNQAHSCAEK